MAIQFNPEWKKQGNTRTLECLTKKAIVTEISLSEYSWEILDSGYCIEQGSANDLYKAFSIIENKLDFVFLDIETELEPNCRCLSCYEPTGRWIVYTRDDRINKVFESEEDAINWCKTEYSNTNSM